MRALACRCFTLAAILAAGAARAQTPDRFSLNTYTVDVVSSNRTGLVTNSEPAVFKLDSENGCVWRLGPKGFTTVIVGAGETPQQREQVRDRLRQIVIPEVSFRNAGISNVVEFFQKQIRRLDPATALDPKDYVRLTIASTGTNSTPVTFNARFIGAWDALMIAGDAAGCHLLIRGNGVIVEPIAHQQTFSRTYRIDPTAKARLGATSPLSLLVELGFNDSRVPSRRYMPESGQLEAQGTWEQLEQLQDVMEFTGLIVSQTDRFRLGARVVAGRHELLLSQSATNRTWLYQALVSTNSVRVERFSEQPIQAARLPPLVPRRDSLGSFVVSTCTVDVVVGMNTSVTTNVASATFKLDSQLGLMWRVDGDALVPVYVAGLGQEDVAQAAEREKLHAVLDRIIVPEVDFRNANINDVVGFFEEVIREHGEPGQTGEILGLNVIARGGPIVRGGPKVPASDDPFALLPEGSDGKIGFAGTSVSFHATQISLWEALNIVLDAAGFEIQVRRGLMIVKPKDAEGVTGHFKTSHLRAVQNQPFGW